jgi:endonuclease/exonuclease/phosphatase family metal-dependent hydrolase
MSMRLATWNCQTGLDSNWDAVEALDADVLVVQECGSGTPEQASDHGWTCEFHAGGWHKGLAVLARSPYAIETVEPSEPFFVSTVISGPNRFRFVGFWAMTEKFAGYSYPRQATRLIEQLPDDGLPMVVAGDFNASKSPQHLKNVELLRALGLVSAYHAHHGVDHIADEVDHTSYFQWKESDPHHMDFVFVPTAWNVRSVEVGTFEAYSAPGGLSDHVPVVVSVSQDDSSPSSRE